MGFDQVSMYTFKCLDTHQKSVSYILLVYRLDNKTHPNALLPLGHGHHKVTRLAINLGFLVLGRKRNFKILEE